MDTPRKIAARARMLAAECRQSARYHERKAREEAHKDDVAGCGSHRELGEDYRLKARALDVYAALCAVGYGGRMQT